MHKPTQVTHTESDAHTVMHTQAHLQRPVYTLVYADTPCTHHGHTGTQKHTGREPRTDSYTQTLHAHTVHTQVHQPRYTDTPRFTHTHTLALVGAVRPPFSANTCHKVCGERM